MKINMGKPDQIFRVVLALAIFGLGYFYKSYWGFIGFVPLLTAYFRRCPGYLPFGISTNKTEKLS